MPDLGVRLQLLVGPTAPQAAPYEVMGALSEVEVSQNDQQRDGFQLIFDLGRPGKAWDFGLLRDGLLDPPHRVSIVVVIKGLPQVLINGVISQHQVIPSREPGRSQLRVTGEDLSLLLDLEDKNVIYRNLSDSAIVEKILSGYDCLKPDIETTTEVPHEEVRVVTQQVTDQAFIRELARRNNFVFYVEPTDKVGRSTAYWGPKDRQNLSDQPALKMNMASDTNVEHLSFDFKALQPVAPQVTIIEPWSKRTIPIPVPDLLLPQRAGRPAAPLRQKPLRDTAKLDFIQATLRALATVGESADAAVGAGEVDAVRYGQALRSRRPVDVCGVGHTHDGAYYVKRVTHSIRRGEYKQSFTLTREGRGYRAQEQ